MYLQIETVVDGPRSYLIDYLPKCTLFIPCCMRAGARAGPGKVIDLLDDTLFLSTQ